MNQAEQKSREKERHVHVDMFDRLFLLFQHQQIYVYEDEDSQQ